MDNECTGAVHVHVDFYRYTTKDWISGFFVLFLTSPGNTCTPVDVLHQALIPNILRLDVLDLEACKKIELSTGTQKKFT
jgi:hypothetical protein